MLAVLRRLAIPAVLLVALIAASVALGRFGNDNLEPMATEVTTTAVDTPVFSVRRTPELLTSPRAAEELTAGLDSWVATLPPQSCFIVSNGAEIIYERQSTLPLSAASNMKILTAAGALEALGGDYTFETAVGATVQPDENGLLAGDLYVVGGGDPVLMTDAYVATIAGTDSRVHSNADTLADQTVATNIADIAGAVVVIENRYDAAREPEGIPDFFLNNGLFGALGGAVLDQGFVGFGEQYASQVADPAPPLPRSTDPGTQFAANFDDLLEARNVRIAARARVDAELPAEFSAFFTFQSPPLSEIVQQMLVNSDNTTAEMLVKELAVYANANAPGSSTAGLLELSNQLTTAGVDAGQALTFDGAGMNAESKASCQVLHDTLNLSQHKDIFRAALPVAGQDGTLADDFIGTAGEGRIRAKSGLLANASALSGYFVTDPGVELTFSLIINTEGEEPITPDQVSGWQRPLPDLLAPYPAGPPIVDLAPTGVTQADLDAAKAAAEDLEAQASTVEDGTSTAEDGTNPVEDGTSTAEDGTSTTDPGDG